MSGTPPAAGIERHRLPDHAYPGLDTLRAFGALAVIVTHVAFSTGHYQTEYVGGLLARLDVGVAIFFVLSGFLLGRPFLRAMRDRGRRPATGRYLWRRFLRIWPTFALAVVAAMFLLPDQDLSPVGWLRSLTLTRLVTVGYDFPHGLTQMWSLEVEVAFYLLLPVLAWVVAHTVTRKRWRPRAVALVLVALGAVSVVWTGGAAQVVAPHAASPTTWLPSYLAWFAAGMLLALVDLQPRSTWAARARGAAASPGALWVTVLGLMLVASTPAAGALELIPETNGQRMMRVVLFTAISTLIVLPAIFARSDSPYARFLAWKPLRYLGVISYASFCFHLIVLELAFRWLDIPQFTGSFAVILLATLVGTLIVSVAVYELVERPLERARNLSLRRRTGRSRKPPTEVATTTPSDASANH